MAPKTSMTSMTNSRTNSMTPEQLVAQFRNDREFEAQIIRIPKVTDYSELEHVAHIHYHHLTGIDQYQLFYDIRNNVAVLDDFHRSWQFPIMTLRRLIHIHFDDEMSVNIDELPALDLLLSDSPLVDIHVRPRFYPDYDY